MQTTRRRRKQSEMMMLVLMILCALPLLGCHLPLCKAKHANCVPRGNYVSETRCMCKTLYRSLGQTRLLFVDRNNEVEGDGHDETCCKHCMCASLQWYSTHQYVGRRNHHPGVRPLSPRDDTEALHQDERVRVALRDHRLPVSLGAFDELRPYFPDCDPPAPTKTTAPAEEAAQLATHFVKGCTSKWQWASSFHTRDNERTAVLSSWMAFRPDSQRVSTLSCTDIGYIAGWYESIMTLGLRAIILHDCVPSAVTAALQNDRISFERVGHNTSSNLHFRQSPYDVRFVQYHDYLQRVADREGRHFDHILMTDMSDVRFRRDPFSAMRARPDIEIFIGAESLAFEDNPFVSEYLEWCAPAYASLLHSAELKKTIPPNCGVVGGQGAAVRRLLAHVVGLYRDRTFEQDACFQPWERSCDMAMFAVALMTGYETLHEDPWASNSRIRRPYTYDSGPPFTSRFTRKDHSLPSYVIHK